MNASSSVSVTSLSVCVVSMVGSILGSFQELLESDARSAGAPDMGLGVRGFPEGEDAMSHGCHLPAPFHERGCEERDEALPGVVLHPDLRHRVVERPHAVEETADVVVLPEH